MKLWLLRHARVLVAPGVCYGVSDVAADSAATAMAAQNFAPHPGPGAVLWSSPATRARELANALQGRRADLPAPILDDRLSEMDFGHWEMKPWDEIPRREIEVWTADFAHHRFGGRESAQEVIERVLDALDWACAQGVPEMVWVTHAGIIRAVMYLLASRGRKEISSARDWPMFKTSMGEWATVEVQSASLRYGVDT